jgi:REP element-mobilizing transposase RayT
MAPRYGRSRVIEVHQRSRLPHWSAQNATCFVTFNLFDAIPLAMQEQLAVERRLRIAELERLKQRATPAEIREIDRLIWERAEDMLDEGSGSCFMNDARIGTVVADAITYFHGTRYCLNAWCVMPNHVHVVMNLLDRLDSILQSWKSFTAKEANRILGRAGKFWQDDYFDRLVRSDAERERRVQYVINNPAKAGLLNWPFVGSYN